jgi:preprotein translocase subunit SecD
MSEPPFPPLTPAPSGPSSLTRYLLAAGMVAVVIAYAVAAFGTRGVWSDPAPQEKIRATFTALPSDDKPPSADVVSQTKKILEQRAHDLDNSSDVVADGDTFTVTLPSPNDDVRSLGERGLLYVRPVIHAIPSQSATEPTPPPPPSSAGADAMKRIADEKALRQSTDQSIQVLAMQFQATRCNDVDDLVDNDDPKLPLVTCSQDGKTVYLLDRSIISGEQIDNATSGFENDSGQYVVDVEFNHDAANVWANFTAANIGTQTAFTLDSHVVSAPMIQEAIPNGKTQISGRFTRAEARDLAGALHHGALPVSLSFKSSERVTVPGPAPSKWPRIALVSAGIGVALTVICGLVYLLRSRPRPDGARGQGGTPI